MEAKSPLVTKRLPHRAKSEEANLEFENSEPTSAQPRTALISLAHGALSTC